MVRECERDPRVIGITAAMNSGTGLSILQKAMPERYFDVGIAEQQARALRRRARRLTGMRPVAAIYSTFLQRAFDQIVHDVCLQNLPVTFCMDRAGLVGDDGPTHHGVFDIAYLRSLPNITLMAPRDEAMLVHMLHTALHDRRPGGDPLPARCGRRRRAAVDARAAARRHRRDPARGRAGRARRLRHGRRQGARRRGPAGRARPRRHRRRRALRQAAGRAAAGRAGRRARPARDGRGGRPRRRLRHAPSGSRLSEEGALAPRILRVGLPDRYVTHGAPGAAARGSRLHRRTHRRARRGRRARPARFFRLPRTDEARGRRGSDRVATTPDHEASPGTGFTVTGPRRDRVADHRARPREASVPRAARSSGRRSRRRDQRRRRDRDAITTPARPRQPTLDADADGTRRRRDAQRRRRSGAGAATPTPAARRHADARADSPSANAGSFTRDAARLRIAISRRAPAPT